jgi:cell division septal protein FtsQ
MRKKKEYPRKRKRFVKKIIFLTTLVSIVVIFAAGTAFYFFFIKSKKPSSFSSMQAVHAAHTTTEDKTYSELQTDLQKEQIAYTTITKGNNEYIVTLQDGGKVTFSSQKDIMSQIASLQYILSHLTMVEGKQFASLDLRFDQPVIVVK